MLSLVAATVLVMAQQAAPAAPPTLEQDRLRACMGQGGRYTQERWS